MHLFEGEEAGAWANDVNLARGWICLQANDKMWSERWCQSICGTQMCIGWEFKARTIRMIYLLVHCCLHDSNSLAMNSAAVLHRTNADLRYGDGAKGYTFPIWWSRLAWATELGVNWVWAGGLADSMRFSGEKQLRYEHIWIWTLKNSFRFLAASWLPCTFCAFLQ